MAKATGYGSSNSMESGPGTGKWFLGKCYPSQLSAEKEGKTNPNQTCNYYWVRVWPVYGRNPVNAKSGKKT